MAKVSVAIVTVSLAMTHGKLWFIIGEGGLKVHVTIPHSRFTATSKSIMRRPSPQSHRSCEPACLTKVSAVAITLPGGDSCRVRSLRDSPLDSGRARAGALRGDGGAGRRAQHEGSSTLQARCRKSRPRIHTFAGRQS